MPSERNRRKVKLGKCMTFLRKRVVPDLMPERVGELMDVAMTTITRMESGHQAPNQHLLHAILSLYNVSDAERAEAIRLLKAAKQRVATVEHASDLALTYVDFRRNESEAVSERTMESAAIPGMLQTAGYASAIADAAWPFNRKRPGGWEKRAADERQGRQRLLTKDNPLQLHAVIDEAVICRVVGTAATMAEQLRHLLTVGEWPNVTVQIVPFAAGAYGAMSGSAIILGFDDDDDLGSVYLEYAAGGATVENPEDVAAFITTFDHVSQNVAFQPDRSADLIREALNRLEGR
ncbi:MAG: Scr1 family TA system antitoxin-like transcriptional regulator [Actinomycetota bacterium]|nr:Scr1 family TA system antitoxin-like transcriptional regulator [Actinomycetota bacterium]